MPETHPYKFAEAFMLMLYASDTGQEQELIWNTRDGATPFIILSNSDVKLRHVNWQSDVRLERFVPPCGMRVFVDLSPERARKIATLWIDATWEDKPNVRGLNHHYSSREEAICKTIDGIQRGPSDLVTVDKTLQRLLIERYAKTPGPIETRDPAEVYVASSRAYRPLNNHPTARTA